MPEPVEDRGRALTSADWQAALWLVLGGAAFGVVAGVVWWLVAPKPRAIVTAQGVGVAPDSGGNFIAGDGWFFFVTLVAGVLFAVLGCLRWRRSGFGVTVGLALGGLLGSLVCWRVGTLLGSVDVSVTAVGLPVGTEFDAGLRLRIVGLGLVWPITSMVLVLGASLAQWFPVLDADSVSRTPDGSHSG